MKHILVIRLSSLGDIVLTQPVCAVLKQCFPQAELTYITKAQFIPLVLAMGTCDKIIEYVGSKTKLPAQRYDLVIDLQSKLSSWLLRQRIKAKRTVAYDKKHLLRQMIVWHLSRKSIPSTLGLYATVLPKIGLAEQVRTALPHPALNVLLKDSPLGAIDTGGRKVVAIFPGAAHETKIYPLDQWKEVIRSTAGRYVYLLLGSPKEEHLCRILHKQCPQNTILTDCRYALDQLIRIINDCDLVISNDSGPMHIAAALGLRQIAIFGATHPRLGFSPMNTNAIVLCRDLDCQPCSLHGGHSCPRGHYKCMKEVSAETIAGLVDQILKDRD